jgi:signal transduction histidine kinase/class 3 adenylate cyclase/CheY-like chemotaxis protein/Tfp pilus assembly protein PilF
MKRIVVLLVYLLWGGWTFSQNADSLRGIWQDENRHDTVRLEAGRELVILTSRTNLDSMRVLAERMLALAKDRGHKDWQVAGNRLLGNAYAMQADFLHALKYFHSSRELAEELGDKAGLAVACNNIGNVYYEQGDYLQSLEYHQRSRKLGEELGDDRGLSRTYNNIGNIYYRQGDFPQALEYYQLSRAWKEKLGDQPGLSRTYNNIGLVYADQGDYTQALDYFQNSRQLAEALGDKAGLARNYNNMASIYTRQGDYALALEYMQKSIELEEEMGNKAGLAITYKNIGEFYLGQKNYPKARSWCSKSFNTARNIGALHLEREACGCLVEAYEGLGDYRRALTYQKQYIDIRDSLFNDEKTRELTRLELQYEFEKEQMADSLAYSQEKAAMEARLIREKARRNRFFYGGLGVLLTGGLIGFFFWRSWNQRQELARQEAELARERRLNERLQQIDKLKDQFLANTSHELRTPLQGIIGLSEGLLTRSDKPEDQEDLSMVISSGRRLNSLVNDILDFSRLKNSRTELHLKPVDLHSLVDVVLHSNAPLTKGKDLALINEIPEGLPAAHGDENRLQQVLYNLIGNAIKFTESGHVKVGASLLANSQTSNKVGQPEQLTAAPLPTANWILVTVADTGIGIPENKQEAIFQAFEQADGSTSREFAGTGLGLSISKRLVELHGGKMWVESSSAEASADKSEVGDGRLTDAVGRGSTFFFTLPVSEEKAVKPTPFSTVSKLRPEAAPSQKEAGVPKAVPLSKPDGIQVLVVDDEPINQQVFKNHLSGENFQLIQAMNGEEALSLLDGGGAFDLVLLDVMMPRISGYEVCRKIREKYLPSELPVIMVTAKNQVQDLVQGLALGANDYLAKPFSKEEFLARIKTQLNLHRIFDAAGKFVPNEFLHALGRESLTEVILGDHTEKEVTVSFLDIRDYSSLSETMTPEENFDFVIAFNGRLGPIIQNHKGFVNQYLGDGIMAIFPESPGDALKAAVEMQRTLAGNNKKRTAQNRRPLRVGIGLHTGPLIMGIIGDQKRMDAATISDTVNTASRIESLTKHYGVNILLSEHCLAKIPSKDDFYLRYLGKVQVKGKKVPFNLYECFNGDLPEIMDKKLKTLESFENGIAHYFAGEFPKARKAFEDILKINKRDETVEMFLKKTVRFLTSGIPDDWTGVEKFDAK